MVYYALMVLPVIVIMSNQLLKEKQSGIKLKIYLSGINPMLYWASWWIFFIILAIVLAIVMGFTFWAVAFYDASLSLIITFFFLVNLSTFTLVWAL